MLKGEKVAFRYSANRPWVLQDVDVTVAPGEVVGISGVSGRGKTTLGKLLAGYLEPTGGRVTLDGERLPRRDYCPVQLVFQNPELAVNPRWRVGQIVSEAHTPAPALLEALSIDGQWWSRWPHELSGGELQRIAVARALNPHTRYLIADEKTAMLDANTQAQLWQAVLNYAHKHEMGVLVISHEAPLLQRLCQRVVRLD